MFPQVSHLVVSLSFGGLERLVAEWTNARNRQAPGSTRIVCLDAVGELAAHVADGAVDCVNACRARRPMDWAAVLRLRRLLLTTGAEVIHSHNVAAWQYAAVACLGTKVRHIHTEHGTNVHYVGIVNRVRLAVIRRLTDQIVAVSESAADELVIKNRIPRKDIVVIVNGVAERKNPESSLLRPAGRDYGGHGIQNPEYRKGMGIPENAFVIGSVGRLAEVKGYDRLIVAFAELGRSLTLDQCEAPGGRTLCEPSCVHGSDKPRPPKERSTSDAVKSDVFLLLIGDGPERANLERKARELKVSDRVVFAGYQPDPAPYLAAMNLFVLPSRSEGVSVALLEAMVAGVPAAVTDVGSNREVVEDGKCGVMLPEDEGAWPETITVVMKDMDAATQRAQTAQQRVQDHYSLEATMDGYELLYVVGGIKKWKI